MQKCPLKSGRMQNTKMQKPPKHLEVISADSHWAHNESKLFRVSLTIFPYLILEVVMLLHKVAERPHGQPLIVITVIPQGALKRHF